jgi:hypothetical protein
VSLFEPDSRPRNGTQAGSRRASAHEATSRNSATALVAVLAVAGLLVGCGAGPEPPSTPAAALSPESVAPENNPIGDIPDTQAYVPFTPPSEIFTVSVPEGWAQTNDAGVTVFTDKLNKMRIEIRPFLDALTPDVVRNEELPLIQAASPGYRFGAVSLVQRKAGPVILATYQVASTPNEVTGKVGVDAVERYSFFRDGHEVVLTLSGPVGADNVDPWRTITDSLQWK